MQSTTTFNHLPKEINQHIGSFLERHECQLLRLSNRHLFFSLDEGYFSRRNDVAGNQEIYQRLIECAKDTCTSYLTEINPPYIEYDWNTGYYDFNRTGNRRAYWLASIFTYCSTEFSLFALSALTSNEYTLISSRLRNLVMENIRKQFNVMPCMEKIVEKIFGLENSELKIRIKELLKKIDNMDASYIGEEIYYSKSTIHLETAFHRSFKPEMMRLYYLDKIDSDYCETDYVKCEKTYDKEWLFYIFTHCSTEFALFAWYTLVKKIMTSKLPVFDFDVKKFISRHYLRKDDKLESMQEALREHIHAFGEFTSQLTETDVKCLEGNIRFMARGVEEKSRSERCAVM